MSNYCKNCEFYEDCDFADNYNFCEDCKNYVFGWNPKT